MNGRRATALACAVMIAAAASSPAAAYQRPGRTERVSVAADGTQGNARSVLASLSPDGRYVAFESLARTLVSGDTNGTTDVFLHDRQTGTIERVSVAADGAQANSWSTGPASISADGRYVAFESGASNLVPGITNGVGDIFVRDRVTGTTERVSVASDGSQAAGFSWGTSMSADGRYVAFESVASNLVPGDTNGHWDVFVRDRVAGTTERVSVSSEGAQGTGVSRFAAISADGRHVAFESSAPNLVPGDTNLGVDVFVHDRETGETERVSVASNGSQGNGESTTFVHSSIDISADGRYVAFHSRATNLVPNDTNDATDLFVHDRQTRTTERVSIASDGAEGNDWAAAPSISADGRYVAFSSGASNLVRGDTNEQQDIFVHDRETGVTERVSVASDGTQGNSWSRFAYMNADGRYVAFDGPASNLAPGITNNDYDVFVRDRGPALGVGDMSVVEHDGAVMISGWATISGAVVAAASDSPGDAGPAAAAAGGELTGARLVYRPEQEDLLVRLDVSSLPSIAPGTCFNLLGFGCAATSTGAGAPAVLYGLSFEVSGTRHEVRALRAAATSMPPSAPYFGLYRCDPDCSELTRLTGGIGTAGEDVRVAVPLAELGLEGNDELSAVRAYTAFGEAHAGAISELDEAHLPDAVLPAARLELGLAPAGVSEDQVLFPSAGLVDGRFSGSIDDESLADGDYDVWARVCLGETCGSTSRRVTLEGDGLVADPG